MKFVWRPVAGKSGLILLIVALLGVMVVIDGLMKGEILRPLAGAIVAWCFGTLMFKGIPWPAPVVRHVESEMVRIRSGRSPPGFSRWPMVIAGAMMGLGFLAVALMMLFGSTEAIESVMPRVARSLRRGEGGDSMIERVGFAVLFAIGAAAALFSAWKRARY
jgi:hypothetical protein